MGVPPAAADFRQEIIGSKHLIDHTYPLTLNRKHLPVKLTRMTPSLPTYSKHLLQTPTPHTYSDPPTTIRVIRAICGSTASPQYFDYDNDHDHEYEILSKSSLKPEH